MVVTEPARPTTRDAAGSPGLQGEPTICPAPPPGQGSDGAHVPATCTFLICESRENRETYLDSQLSFDAKVGK
ncbi:hypothetical protein YUYDRAFT_06749 [Streptomyces sp. ScaeMP-e48]|nr:hypothetical protein YUYDRAFT_06749 [Streptomyces sp. ScaeMP-e48]